MLGLALGWIYPDGHRSLTAPMLNHALINLLIEPWLMLGFVRLGLFRWRRWLQLWRLFRLSLSTSFWVWTDRLILPAFQDRRARRDGCLDLPGLR